MPAASKPPTRNPGNPLHQPPPFARTAGSPGSSPSAPAAAGCTQSHWHSTSQPAPACARWRHAIAATPQRSHQGRQGVEAPRPQRCQTAHATAWTGGLIDGRDGVKMTVGLCCGVLQGGGRGESKGVGRKRAGGKWLGPERICQLHVRAHYQNKPHMRHGGRLEPAVSLALANLLCIHG